MAQLNEAINNDLNQLSTWLQANKLSLNVAKTHSMLIPTKQKQDGLSSTNQNLELNICGNELYVVQKTKYLTFYIAVLSGVVVVLLKLSSCRSFRTGLREL